jgi:6-pyruvoyl-tetrahydropterin synthase
MKVLDFLKRVLDEAKADLAKAGITELTTDVDLPDDVVNTYASNLLTRERAEADPIIFGKLKGRIYSEVNDGFDKDFIAFAEANLPKETTDKIKAEKITRAKWDLLRGSLPKAGTETEQMKAARLEIEKLHTELKAKDTTFEAFKSESDGKLTNFQKNFMLSQEVAKLPIADTAKQFLTLADIQNKFVEALDKKGIILQLDNNTLIPKVKTAEGALMDHYTGNVRTTLPDLFNAELKQYLKQSNGGNGGGAPPAPPAPPKTVHTGLSLQEMNAVAVKEKFEKERQARAQQ